PVGGIKEKVLAAHRAGIKRVILPERNKKDLVDIPDEIKQEMDLVHIKRMEEVLPLALEPETDAVKVTPAAGGSGGARPVPPPPPDATGEVTPPATA
ncbi:MAG TPA: S16 family serine protease, partial [Polyangia bacterium]